MPRIDELSRLFKALVSKNYSAAEGIANEIAAEEEKKGHRTASQLLKGSLVSNGTKTLSDDHGQRNNNGSSALLMSALSSRTSNVAFKDVYLRKDARARLEEVVKEFKNQNALKALGIHRRSKLILHGPPGCGKSLAAQALANELKVPLFVVRFDSIIGAYLGQTATHLRQLFQFAETNDCVLLFDEVDALGKRRGSPTDVGELDRIVIALMQELELSELRGFVLATSNIPDSLDPALWRRFDMAIHFPGPNKGEILRFARTEAEAFQLSLSKELLQRVSVLKNYAEVEKAIEDEARRLALRSMKA
jgi:SpoVK/Ycf46/Vps4 family AAA+-type ATPase